MMINFFRMSVIAIAFLFDIVLTFIFIAYYRKKNPKDKNWADMELNPVMRFCWSKFGFVKGTLVCASIICPVIFLVSYLVSFDNWSFGFFVGVYYVVFLVHYGNLKTLFEKK